MTLRFPFAPRQTECERTRESLSEYLDGRLPPLEERQTDDHLARCAECSAELEALRRTVALLRDLPAVPVPRSFLIPAGEPRRAGLLVALSVPALGRATALVAAAFAVSLSLTLMAELQRPATSSPTGQAKVEQAEPLAARSPSFDRAAPEGLPEAEKRPAAQPTAPASAAGAAPAAAKPAATPAPLGVSPASREATASGAAAPPASATAPAAAKPAAAAPAVAAAPAAAPTSAPERLASPPAPEVGQAAAEAPSQAPTPRSAAVPLAQESLPPGGQQEKAQAQADGASVAAPASVPAPSRDVAPLPAQPEVASQSEGAEEPPSASAIAPDRPAGWGVEGALRYVTGALGVAAAVLLAVLGVAIVSERGRRTRRSARRWRD